ncbi:MAG: oligosaccharide flippase family protein, partial [Allosphingosinicella sp.]
MPQPVDRPSLYRGAALAVALQWALRLIGLVSVVILARLLSPADFGIAGLAAAALAFVELLGMIGLRQALLRIDEPDRAHLDTAFTIQLMLFSAMGLLGLASAPLVARLYGEPALAAVIAALSCRYFLLGLVNIGIVEFDRNLEFGRDLKMRVSARLLAFAVTIAAAFLLRSYWALVIGLICQSGFHAAASWIAHPYRPKLTLKRRSELLGLSLWMFANTVAQTVQQQVERLALGRFGSAHLIGLFSVSKDLSDIFTQEIATALNRVTFVAVARSNKPLDHVPERVPMMLGAYAMIAAPMGFGLAATSSDAIAVLLGSQWLEAAPILELVAVYSAFFAVYRMITSSLQASGQARLAAALSTASAIVLVLSVGLVSLLRPDVMSLAWTALAANAAVLLGGLVVLTRVSHAGFGRLVSALLRPFAAAAFMAIVVRLAAPASAIPLVDLVSGFMVGAIAFPLGLAVLWLASGRP